MPSENDRDINRRSRQLSKVFKQSSVESQGGGGASSERKRVYKKSSIYDFDQQSNGSMSDRIKDVGDYGGEIGVPPMSSKSKLMLDPK